MRFTAYFIIYYHTNKPIFMNFFHVEPIYMHLLISFKIPKWPYLTFFRFNDSLFLSSFFFLILHIYEVITVAPLD